jgi:fructose-1,6-bisphosphatase I
MKVCSHDILNVLKKCFAEIAKIIRESDVKGVTLSKHTESTNETGDDVKHLDVISNNILKKALLKCRNICFIGSEEEPVLIPTKYPDGEYVVCFDPLDGSSNIAVNITVGTIFAIYKVNDKVVDRTKLITNGKNIVCAGYCLYGGSTQLIVANTFNVNMYSLFLDSTFVLTHESIIMPNIGNIYAINESNRHKFIDPSINRIISKFIEDKKTTRWVGSLVADAHRTLIQGGFFAYPRNTSHPHGRLRLLYEVYPMAYIIEKAGGKTTTSNGEYDSLLDIPFPKDCHQKVSCILSSKYEMIQYRNILECIRNESLHCAPEISRRKVEQ